MSLYNFSGESMIDYIYNPTTCKTPKGVSLVGSTIKYEIKVSKFKGIESVDFVLHKDGEQPKPYPMTRVLTDERYIHYEYKHTYSTTGHFWYHFEAHTPDDTIRLVAGDRLDVRAEDVDDDYLELIIEKDSTVGKDFRRGVIYHIFVDRFCKKGKVTPRAGLTLNENWREPVEYEYDSTGKRVNRKCYGGNFEGIISKLDYLEKLGVTMLYLSPIFEAHSSHKYNIADYNKIDEMFGGETGFKKLIKAADKKGMKIIIDGVFNHTGSDSVYFNQDGRYDSIGACQSKDSPYYKWYTFGNYKYGYSTWWDMPTLPQTNENSTFFDFIAGKGGVIEKYMKMGVYGFRLDVADELSDKFLNAINKMVKSINPEGYIVGEVWEDAASKIAYSDRKKYFLGNSLDSVTNYPMKNAIIDFVKNGDASHFASTINMVKAEYPHNVKHSLMNVLGSHDTMRVMTKLMTEDNAGEIRRHIMSEEEWDMGFKLLKIATVLQYTTVGVPTVYYGDEVGMTGGRDPFCRETYPWGEEREKILDWYIRLGKLRKRPAIYEGDLNILYNDESVLVYERRTDNDKVMVAVNRGEGEHTLTFNDKMYDLLRNREYYGEVTLAPDSYFVLSREKECIDHLEELVKVRKSRTTKSAITKKSTKSSTENKTKATKTTTKTTTSGVKKTTTKKSVSTKKTTTSTAKKTASKK